MDTINNLRSLFSVTVTHNSCTYRRCDRSSVRRTFWSCIVWCTKSSCTLR